MPHAIAATPVTPADVLRAAAGDPEQLAVIGFLARYSGHTLRDYTHDLKAFHAFCVEAGITMLGATRAHLELYLRVLQTRPSPATGRPLAAATINRRFSTVATFLDCAEADDLIAKNPARHVRRVTLDREAQRRTWFQIGDFHLLVRTARTFGARDHALILLMATTGIRVNEVCSLDVTSVHIGGGSAYVEYVRKGGKLTRPDLPVEVLLAVERLIDGRTDGPLFLNRDGRRMDRRSVDRIIDRIRKAAGIPYRVTPHGMRRSFATTASRLGASDSDVQRALYQADPRTTLLYIRRERVGSVARHMVADLLGESG